MSSGCSKFHSFWKRPPLILSNLHAPGPDCPAFLHFFPSLSKFHSVEASHSTIRTFSLRGDDSDFCRDIGIVDPQSTQRNMAHITEKLPALFMFPLIKRLIQVFFATWLRSIKRFDSTSCLTFFQGRVLDSHFHSTRAPRKSLRVFGDLD